MFMTGEVAERGVEFIHSRYIIVRVYHVGRKLDWGRLEITAEILILRLCQQEEQWDKIMKMGSKSMNTVLIWCDLILND